MNKQSENAINKIKSYFNSDRYNTFFINIDNSEIYKEVLEYFYNEEIVRVSDFCVEEDSFPDFQKLYDYLNSLDKRCIVIGLGEYITLSNQDSFIGNMINSYFDQKVLVLCRSISEMLEKRNDYDLKFNSNRYQIIDGNLDYKIIKTVYAQGLNQVSIGFKSLLKQLENAKFTGNFYVNTVLPINYERILNTPFDNMVEIDPYVSKYFNKDSLTNEEILDYLENNNLDDGRIDSFKSFIKYKINPSGNPYIDLVVSHSKSSKDYRDNIVNYLIYLNVKDKNFESIYLERKKLLKDYPDEKISDYVNLTKIKEQDRIFYLTDNTFAERKEIVREISKIGYIPKELKVIYNDLYLYLQDYVFDCKKSSELTQYFIDYKRQKVLNKIEPEFLNVVNDYAIDNNRLFNLLNPRNYYIDKYNKNPRNSLYWIDALGVEFLNYIQNKANQFGLSIKIDIARSYLPSITDINKDFYDNWNGEKSKESRLDNVKHNGDDDYNYSNEKSPIHLCTELSIIDDVLKRIKTNLSSNKFDGYVIASDHGASRLALINQNENRFKVENTGEHSGRCCKVDCINEKLPFAFEENGYWSLANYDLFKGGRKNGVEVHGGASLEEVVVPIIYLTLKTKNYTITIKNEKIKINKKESPIITLYSTSELDNLSLVFNKKKYNAKYVGNNYYHVQLSDFNKAGNYQADIYVEDNYYKTIEFVLESDFGTINDDDDFFS